MSDNKKYHLPFSATQKAYLDEASYQKNYQWSIENPNEFWGAQALKFISWFAPWKAVQKGSFETLDMAWFVGGKLNACYNCVDRHLEKHKDKVALIWEGDSPNEIRHITYGALHQEICRFSSVLKTHGIKKGDRVCIYLPMIPEAVVAMLACARIGAIHSVVFAGFSSEAIKTRLLDANARLVITADEGLRGGKIIPIKAQIDKALQDCPFVNKVIVIKRTGGQVGWNEHRDEWYHEQMAKVASHCPIEVLDAEDPLFILYTSGSTGKPKGIVHTLGGYLVYVAMTHHYLFNHHEDDIYWCTADLGWITGHSYLVYGPLTNGATIVLYEGTPYYPNFSRYWEIIDRHQVNIFYTAPTAIRALRREGETWVKRTSRASLKILGTVGEPINPDVWEWYFEVVGEERCPIVDTWWQTETGGAVIAPIPGASQLKPGAATKPFFGIVPDIVDEKGAPVSVNQTGKLVIKKPWPGLMHTIYNHRQRFIDTYFKNIPGCYETGDEARCDEDGDYWILGRDDDVIKVSGHRLGSGELESAFVAHPAVSEAAVVSIPHDIKGQSIYAYITTIQGISPTEDLKKELIQHIQNTYGKIATPEKIQWAKDLPKTRSGKIMRRILRKIALNETTDLGDISTLANPDIMGELIRERSNIMIEPQ